MAGRPRIYDNEAELEKAIEDYFVHIQGLKQLVPDEKGSITEVWTRNPEPATVTGLALFLGFESRQSIYDYEGNGLFSYIIKNARLRVEHEYEKRLTTAQSPTGAIFALKNMGWSDKQELSGPNNQPLMPSLITIQPIQTAEIPIGEKEE